MDAQKMIGSDNGGGEGRPLGECTRGEQGGDPGAGSSVSRGIIHAIMFCVLAFSAMAVFAACVLVPVWSEAEEVHQYERVMAGIVARLENQIARNEAHLESLRGDPLVNERIVRRELNYRPEQEQFIRWTVDDLRTVRFDPSVSRMAGDASLDDEVTVPHRPAWVSALGRWLPAWPWQDLFGRSPNRPLLLAMSAGLLLAAFLLYSPPRASLTYK